MLWHAMLARCVSFGASPAARQAVSGTGMLWDDEYRHGVKGTTGLHDSRESHTWVSPARLQSAEQYVSGTRRRVRGRGRRA